MKNEEPGISCERFVSIVAERKASEAASSLCQDCPRTHDRTDKRFIASRTSPVKVVAVW